jgi:predicted signal transduction protein with EAL and GGDEF domain
LRIVAEGVETAVAYTELTRLGCDQAQGYFMSRPVSAVELDRWLGSRDTDGDRTDRLPADAITSWRPGYAPPT